MLAPHRHTKPIKLKMATPLTSTNTTEPLSLKLFNHATVDLDRKGKTEIECYKKYLFNHD